MKGWGAIRSNQEPRQQRTRSITADSILSKAFARTDRIHADSGIITSEKVAKLCGEHQEHAYEALRLTTHGSQGLQCNWTTDDHTIALGTSRNTLILVNVLTATRVASFQKGQQRFSHCSTPSISHAAVYGDPVAPAIELQVSGANKFAFLEGHTSEVCCCCLSQDGTKALSCGREGQLFLWTIDYSPTGDPQASKQQLLSHCNDTTVKRCCLATEAAVAASGDSQGYVRFWSISSRAAQLRTSVKPFADGVFSLTLSADGSMAAAGSKAGHVVLIQVDTGQVSDLPAVHADSCKVKACAISPDSTKLLTGGDDCKAVLWDIATRQALLVMSEHSRPIRGCCFSSNGARMATCGEDCLLVVYDVVLLCRQDRVLTPCPLVYAPRRAARTNTGSNLGGDSSSMCKADSNATELRRCEVSGPGTSAGGSMLPLGAVVADGAGGVSGSSPELKRDKMFAYIQSGRRLEPTSSAGDVLEAFVGSGSSSSSSGGTVGQGNAYLTRVRVNDGDRLLGCQVVQGSHWEGCSGQLPASFMDSIICAEQSEQLVWLEAGSSTAHAAVPGTKPDAKVACCSFNEDAVATAKRDGSVSILSCAGIMADAMDPAWDRPPTLSVKVEMTVFGISLCVKLGLVALAGVEKKQSQAGGLWLWEFDPSHFGVEPVLSSGLETLERMVSTRTAPSGILGSIDSRVNSTLLAADGQGSSPHMRNGSLIPGTRDGPTRLVSCTDTALYCCAWAAKGEASRVVVGSGAGWLSVVDLEDLSDEPPTRFQIHTCEVTAVDLAANGSTVASGGKDGMVVVWSAITGFKLCVLTLHTSVIRSVRFDADCTHVAVGDSQGMVSGWNLMQGALLGSAAAHDGPCNDCHWGGTLKSLISCGHDGYLSQLVLEPEVMNTYDHAFKALYHSSSKKNKVHRLQTPLLWHLQHGVLRDASVLQSLVLLAAQDGNAAVLSLLMPIFKQHGWLLHFGPVFAVFQATPSKRPLAPLMGPPPFAATFPGGYPAQGAPSSPTERTAAGGGDGPSLFRRSHRWIGNMGDVGSVLSATLGQEGSLKSDSHQQEQLTPQFPGHSSSSSPRTTNGDVKEYSPGWTPDSGTPQRLLTPCSSQKARTAAALTSLHTLHEEGTSHVSSGEDTIVSFEGAAAITGRPGVAEMPAKCCSPTSSPVSLLGLQISLPETPRAAGSDNNSSNSKPAEVDAPTCNDAPTAAEGAASGSPCKGGDLPRPKLFWRRSLTPQRDNPDRVEVGPASNRTDEALAPLQLPHGLQQQQGLPESQPLPLLSVIQTHKQYKQKLPRSSSSPALWQLQLQESIKEEQQQQHHSRQDKQQQQLHRHPLFSPKHTAEGHAAFSASSSRNQPLGSLSRIVVGAGAGDQEDPVQHQEPSQERRLTWQQSIQRVMLRFGGGSLAKGAGVGRASLGGAGDGSGEPAGGLGEPGGTSGWPSRDNMAFRTSKSSLTPWESLRRASKQSQGDMSAVQAVMQPPRNQKAAARKDNLLQLAMASQHAQAVRLVVDALLEGSFSKASVMQHLYEALQALIHDQQHKRVTRRLLKHLPMVDNGEVEVDAQLTQHSSVLYKCSSSGHPGHLWASATASQEPLLDAMDVLIKRASWRDSIYALAIMPTILAIRHCWSLWLWITRRTNAARSNRVMVSASSKLVPIAAAAEIRKGSRNLLRQLISANVDADLYGKELVRAVIQVKWESFARAFLLMQFVQFMVFLILFIAYLGISIYHNDPQWTTREMIQEPAGQAAVVLESLLMILMFGQAADEVKQMVTYKKEYFDSPWNYMDVASCVIIAVLFLLHITRLSNQVYVILMALEFLLLCLRMLYFCMAIEQIGALLRMVLIVIKDMRYFFVLLIALLCSFGLTFSVLLSPPADSSVSVLNIGVGAVVQQQQDSSTVFGTFEDAILQLFTLMLGDVQYDTLKSIVNINTVASRLAVTLACSYAVLVLVVLVNLLIAIVDETYGIVKESEADQILRNKALIIDEIESTLTDACIKDLNSRVLLPYVHILVPQQAVSHRAARHRDLTTKLRKLKTFIKERLPDGSPSAAAPAPVLQQQLQQVSTSVAALETKLEGVAIQAAAVQELSQKVDALQGDMAQIKDLLLAVLAKSP